MRKPKISCGACSEIPIDGLQEGVIIIHKGKFNCPICGKRKLEFRITSGLDNNDLGHVVCPRGCKIDEILQEAFRNEFLNDNFGCACMEPELIKSFCMFNSRYLEMERDDECQK